MNNVNFSEENWFLRQRNEEEEENWMFLIFEDFLTVKYCIFLAFVLEAKSQNWAAGLVILKVKCLDG